MMKVLAAILMFVTLGVIGNAQAVTAPEAKVLGHIVSQKGVKNAPFSADAVSESVQILADGNRIVRSSTSKLYRNSEGRFRQELTGGTGGLFGSFFSYGDGVSVINPMGGSFSLDTGSKIARVFENYAGQGIALAAPIPPIPPMKAIDPIKISPVLKAELEAWKGQGKIEEKDLSPAARAEIEALKQNAEKFKVDMEQYKGEADKFKRAAEELRAATVASAGLTTAISPGVRQKWDTRTEELGEQNIEGVNAKGTRTITTIPAGAIGNERLIETVYEKWYSPELQVVVLSKHSDPRFGEQTYRLTNINRNEPDPSLFQVPNGYKVVSDGKGAGFTYSTKAQAVERAAAKSKSATVSRVKNQF